MAGGMNWERATQRSKISRNGSEPLDLPSAAGALDRCFHEWSEWELVSGSETTKMRWCTECAKQQTRKISKPASTRKGVLSPPTTAPKKSKKRKASSARLIVSSGKNEIPVRKRARKST
jgi:hypothetical protein